MKLCVFPSFAVLLPKIFNDGMLHIVKTAFYGQIQLYMWFDMIGLSRDRGDHFKVAGLKNLGNTKKH